MLAARLLLVASLLAAPAVGDAAKDPLVFVVRRGDSVASVVGRNARTIRRHVPRERKYRRQGAQDLVRQLLQDNLPTLPHGIHPGNQIRVFADGHIEVSKGRGKAPQPFASTTQLRQLVLTIPDAVHDQLKEWAHQGAVKMQSFAISEDNESVTVGDRVWTAGTGIQFAGRDTHFHVLGVDVPTPFNIAVWPFDGIEFAFPSNPFFHATPAGQVALKRDADAVLANLIASGEMHPHEDHYHITRKYEFAPWQKIVTLAADDSVPRLRKQLAQGTQVRLLQEELFIDSREPAADLEAIEVHVQRAWQGLESFKSGPQMSFLISHNAAIVKDGKILHLGDYLLSAGEGLHFDVCAKHVHVRGTSDMPLNVVLDPPVDGSPPSVAENIFIRLEGEHVLPKMLDPRVARIISDGKVELHHDSYHVTPKLAPKAFAAIDAVVTEEKILHDLRQGIRETVDGVLHDPLPTHTTRAFLVGLERQRQRILAIVKELPKIPKLPPPPEKKATPTATKATPVAAP